MENTRVSRLQAEHLIEDCADALWNEVKEATLDRIIWSFFISTLSDSLYNTDREYLLEIREILLGHSTHFLDQTIISEDFRSYFTVEEMEWYTQLWNMLTFLSTFPFVAIHEAIAHTKQNGNDWETIAATLPEILLVQNGEEEYLRRKAQIKTLAAQCPTPESIGDEKIYHLILREVTTLLTVIHISKSAIHYGYPIPDISYSPNVENLDISENFVWSKRALEALTGKGGIFLSCHLSKSQSFDGDILFFTLH